MNPENSAVSEVGDTPPVCSPTASREVFDRWTAKQMSQLSDNPALLARLVEKQYPKTTAQAVAELHFRGFDVSEPMAEQLAPQIGVNFFGSELAWHKSEIDELAQWMVSFNSLTHAARRREWLRGDWEADHV
jgi:hypothetical protein